MMRTRKLEFIIVLLLLTAAIASVVLIKMHKPEGNTVHIYADGSEYGIYDLNTDRDIEIKSEDGYNLVRIVAGRVWMESADCPNQLCVNMLPLSYGDTDMIVCLPHKIIIKLE